jgi:hypothetical protein
MTPFIQFLKDNYPNIDLIGAEIGVFIGINAAYLLQNLSIGRLYLVDTYKPYFDGGQEHYTQDQMNNFHATMMRTIAHSNFENVMPIIQESAWAAKLFSDNYFDFVYIDASHAYDDVLNDINTWWPKVKHGGLFGGHDYGNLTQNPMAGAEVKKAVDDFLKEKKIPVKDPSIGLRSGEAMEWAVFKP